MNYKKNESAKHWVLGPFTRLVNYPVIKPSSELKFECPMNLKTINWAENHTFNPAAILYNDKINVLFRSEDGKGDVIGRYTSRIGRAISLDGVNFKFKPEPLIYPADDKCRDYEWYGGCEDPRIIESEDGIFHIYYSMWNFGNEKTFTGKWISGVATSKDLINWEKHGPIFEKLVGNDIPPYKACGVVQKIVDGKLIAAKINGKYYMYWGEAFVGLATSTDLINWEPEYIENGDLLRVISPRAGHFDSVLTEVGPPPVITENGIVLIYNGKNSSENGDKDIDGGAYTAGQLLLDKNDPTKVLDRLDKPFLKPELDFEKTGQYEAGTVFVEGLVIYKNKWHLYYGTADTYVGVATAPYKVNRV